MRQAVILAGGLGTRLKSRLGDVPKPLVTVGGRSLLQCQIGLLRDQGIRDVMLLVNHRADLIRAHCRANGDFGARLEFVEDEGYARGTAGALFACLDRLDEEFLVIYGDLMLEMDLGRLIAYHRAVPATDATLTVHPNDHPHDSDLVELDDDGRVIAFHSKPHSSTTLVGNLVNAAVYVLRRDSLRPYVEMTGLLDFGRDIFPAMLADGALLRGYASSEYIKDVGTPERLDAVERDHSTGRIRRASLRHRQQAIFIDRDGTLNAHAGHVSSPEQLQVYEFVGPALRRLNEAGLLAIVVTNQPVVARGECDFKTLRRINAKLELEVARSEAYFDRIYVCPHHPHTGYAGEVKDLKIDCDCRKPKPGLILRACDELNISAADSWMIGDTPADIGAGSAAGVATIRISPQAQDEGTLPQPDFVRADFGDAVDFVLDGYPRMRHALEAAVDRIECGDRWLVVAADARDLRDAVSVVRCELRRRDVACVARSMREAQSTGGQTVPEPAVKLWYALHSEDVDPSPWGGRTIEIPVGFRLYG